MPYTPCAGGDGIVTEPQAKTNTPPRRLWKVSLDLLQQLINCSSNNALLDFAGLVVNRIAGRIQDHNMRNIAEIIFLHQLQLRRREPQIHVNHDELHPSLIFVVKINGAASLPLGIESTFGVKNHIIGLTGNGPVL